MSFSKLLTDPLSSYLDQLYVRRWKDFAGEGLVRERSQCIRNKIQQEAMKEGILDIFMEAGFCVTNPTCGACLGMSTGVLAEGEVCASTTNRNFMGRMGKGGMVHLMSPATAAASAIEGKIADPRKYL